MSVKEEHSPWMVSVENFFRMSHTQSYGNGCEKVILLPIRLLIEEHLPNILYKMSSVNRYSIDSLKNNVVGMTSTIAFNDPYDTVQKIDEAYIKKSIMNESILEKLYPMMLAYFNPDKVDDVPLLFGCSEAQKKAFIEIVNEEWSVERFSYVLSHPAEYKQSEVKGHLNQLRDFQQQIAKCTFVSCFTTDVCNMLMWSHYACNHKGVALGYDFRLPCNEDAKASVYPVVYSERKIDITIDLQFSLLKSLQGDRQFSIDKLLGVKSSIFKSSDWEYEHEWRIVKRNIQDEGMHTVSPLVASEIYYGCRISDEDYEVVHKIAQEKGLREYRMEVDVFSEDYSLKFVDVNG